MDTNFTLEELKELYIVNGSLPISDHFTISRTLYDCFQHAKKKLKIEEYLNSVLYQVYGETNTYLLVNIKTKQICILEEQNPYTKVILNNHNEDKNNSLMLRGSIDEVLHNIIHINEDYFTPKTNLIPKEVFKMVQDNLDSYCDLDHLYETINKKTNKITKCNLKRVLSSSQKKKRATYGFTSKSERILSPSNKNKRATYGFTSKSKVLSSFNKFNTNFGLKKSKKMTRSEKRKRATYGTVKRRKPLGILQKLREKKGIKTRLR